MNDLHVMIIKTNRLILRPWKEEDFVPFAKLNADPRVREYFPSISSRKESDESARVISSEIEKKGFGLWAVSCPGVSDFIGFIGLTHVPFTAHFTPAVEIGWRLAHEFWGRGYATEGAEACLKYGFERLNLDEIVSFTTVSNERSQNVMRKIGMHHTKDDDFDHPKIAEGHPLRRHVLYRIQKTEFFKNSSSL